MTAPWSASVTCEDAFGRPKEVVVLVDTDGYIAVQYPPGEGIRFRSAEDAHQFQQAIRAAIEAQRAVNP
jgi:hypothetical protein